MVMILRGGRISVPTEFFLPVRQENYFYDNSPIEIVQTTCYIEDAWAVRALKIEAKEIPPKPGNFCGGNAT